jgi:heterodisulfide reductase subunit A
MGAASKSSGDIASERGKLVEVIEYPPEIDVEATRPRIGVFICHCGVNIGAIVDCAALTEWAETLPGVVFTDHNLYTCSSDTQIRIKEMIKEHDLNRVVVASCTPRTHEPLFQNTIREAGVNPYLFDLTSLREHVSWVHRNEPDRALEKAKRQVAKAVAKVRVNKPVHKEPVEVVHKCLIVGGGVAGMTAALDIAEQGFEVYIVEKEPELGGNLRNIHHTLSGEDPQKFLDEIIKKVMSNDKIHVLTNTKLSDLGGYIGNFEVKVEPATETACDGGSEVEEEKDKSVECQDTIINVGAIIVATGAKELKPEEYLYGQDERVMTQLEMDKKMVDEWKSNPELVPKEIVMIQCVGSRCEDRPYCSRVCCSEAVKNALAIKKEYPDTKITILYRDMRTYSFKEKYYRQARELGILFIRFPDEIPPEVTKDDKGLNVIAYDPIIKRKLLMHPDLVVLSAGTIPYEENEELGQILKVPLTSDKFFLEAHLKIKPLDFSTDGIFLCGTAHSPKFSDESIAQASGAAARAVSIISQNNVETEGIPILIDEERCSGCGICEANCSYSAIKVNPERGVAEVTPVLCKGCGTCSNVCPSSVPYLRQLEPKQLLSMIEAAMEGASA